jgi:hypothetical protein
LEQKFCPPQLTRRRSLARIFKKPQEKSAEKFKTGIIHSPETWSTMAK